MSEQSEKPPDMKDRDLIPYHCGSKRCDWRGPRKDITTDEYGDIRCPKCGVDVFSDEEPELEEDEPVSIKDTWWEDDL